MEMEEYTKKHLIRFETEKPQFYSGKWPNKFKDGIHVYTYQLVPDDIPKSVKNSFSSNWENAKEFSVAIETHSGYWNLKDIQLFLKYEDGTKEKHYMFLTEKDFSFFVKDLPDRLFGPEKEPEEDKEL